MEWLSSLIYLAGSTIITTVIGLIIKSSVSKRQDQEKEFQRLKRKEEHDELVKNINKSIDDAISPIKEDLKLLKNGEQANLRNDLLNKYNECSATGYRTVRDTQDWEDMYEAYHNLNGNSFIDQTKLDFERIPTEERYKVIHNIHNIDNERLIVTLNKKVEEKK